MGQKYKFFIRGCAVIITDKASESTVEIERNPHYNSDNVLDKIESIFRSLELDQNVEFLVSDPKGMLVELFDRFRVITAAGGFVEDGHDQVLMIYRRGYWDLPKGKLEKNESLEQCAMREVEEECGVSELEIVSDSFETYHLYSEKNDTVIKRSVWFRMRCLSDDNLTPQTEEDIELAEWKNQPLSPEIILRSYASIQEVINYFS